MFELTIKALSVNELEEQVLAMAARFRQGTAASPAPVEAPVSEARQAGPSAPGSRRARSGAADKAPPETKADPQPDAGTEGPAEAGDQAGEADVAAPEGQPVSEEEAAPGVTLDDIQVIARKLSGVANIKAVLAIFKEFGIVEPKNTPEEKFAEVYRAFELAIAEAASEAA